MLKSYLLNTYTARKLGMKTTGNAVARHHRAMPASAMAIFHRRAASERRTRFWQAIPNGFYVTELIGSGVNIVTGDYSRGAAGLWIRNGELAFPVSEVTIAGNLKNMLLDMEAIGSDLEFRGSTAAPTLLHPGDDRWRQINADQDRKQPGSRSPFRWWSAAIIVVLGLGAWVRL